jgi:uncharacterized membrane protein
MQQLISKRIHSIDVLRGLVMIIMALDHVREFFHVSAMTSDPLDPETTYPALFFTRWVTHFCAPVFVFLSGISARLAGTRRTQAELSRFLITRGLWLVVAEIIIVTLGLTFNPFYNVIILQVIWAIGTSMILLGLLVHTSPVWIGVIGVILFFGHNLSSYAVVPDGTAGSLYQLLLTARAAVIPISDNHFIFALYAVLPWASVMFLGYIFGNLFLPAVSPERRARYLRSGGVAAIALFIILRLINGYGDPAPWSVQDTPVFSVLSFLNTSKYPPSLMFLLMTLGPAMVILSFLEQMKNRVMEIVSVFGKVPFFYYLVHFYLIHLLTAVAFFASGYGVSEIVQPQNPFFFRPVSFGYELWMVYVIWGFVLVLLYRPCLWFSHYKQTHKQWWLSYI